MAAVEKWILLANAPDDTLMKNEIVYRYAERYSTVPSISGQYVDLYINGDYLGNYYLCEKVEVGRNRLPLTDLETATETVNPAIFEAFAEMLHQKQKETQDEDGQASESSDDKE